MNKLDKQYTDLLQDILNNGIQKSDRTGTGTLSVFGRQIRHKMSDGFPLLTTKKMHFKSIVTELLWFLRGDTNIKYLVDNGCHIWDGDAYKAFHNKFPETEMMSKEDFIETIRVNDEFAKKHGELGPIYGKQWRSWKFTDKFTNGEQIAYVNGKVDQIANLINELKTNPDSRRLMVNAWNVGELDQMVLTPCHYGFQVWTRELSLEERNYSLGPDDAYLGIFGMNEKDDLEYKELFDKENRPTRAISLMWNQRSVDTFLGLPFNIASYGLLLEIIAKEVNMVPDQLIGNLGDVHLYNNHIEQAKEQIAEIPWEERKEFLTPEQFKDFGNISPFTDKMIKYWLNSCNVPYSRRMPFELPTLIFEKEIISNIFSIEQSGRNNYNAVSPDDLQIENYQSHPNIKAPLSN